CGPAVTVLVVTDDQTLGHSLRGDRRKGLHRIGHGLLPVQGKVLISRRSKRVMLSALVQSAIFPARVNVLSVAVNNSTPSNEALKRSPSALSPSVCHSFEVTFLLALLSCSLLPFTTR